MKLPTILKELRESNQYSQKLVSQRIGCSASIISSYETGERLPSIPNLIALADLYHVSTDYLLGRESKGKALDTAGLGEQQIHALEVIVRSMRK